MMRSSKSDLIRSPLTCSAYWGGAVGHWDAASGARGVSCG
eukprot:SAG31_NODE_38176_length_298_cov_0.969849_1_plen_39_part_01